MEPEIVMKIDHTARRLLKGLVEPRILVTVESTLYLGCCGGYEEKSLKVQEIGQHAGPSSRIITSDGITVYLHPDAVSLITSRGGHFTIYGGLNGQLYSDQ